MKPAGLICISLFLSVCFPEGVLAQDRTPISWQVLWPETDFSRHSVPLSQIRWGGVPRDGIRPIDNPSFVDVDEIDALADTEPVLGLIINGDARAYPLRVMTVREIVNDVVGGVPVAVTFCPLCNTGIAFDRRVDGEVLDFGTSGNLRNSDLVMYDRQTESWWQQFTGEAIVGEMTGATLAMVPIRLESWVRFRERAPEGRVLVGDDFAGYTYGRNPYPDYDRRIQPMLYAGAMPDGIAPLARVVRVGDSAWALDLVRRETPLAVGDLIITWEAGQASALDDRFIPAGRDVGNVMVQRRTERGLEDVVHEITFAFAFHAFHPEGTIHLDIP